MAANVRQKLQKILSSSFHPIIRTLKYHSSQPECSSYNRTSPKKCKKKTPYMICQPKTEEFKTIVNLAERAYFREEPTLKFLGIKMNPVLEKRIIDRLSEGNSLLAKCKYTGEILGVAINETIKPWDPIVIAKFAQKQRCPQMKKLLMFHAYLEKAPRLFEKDPCLFEIFKTTNVFLVKRERKFGLGMMLTKECVNLAIKRKYRLVRCDATNFAFSQLLEKLRFKLIMEVPYSDYIDENGERIFKNIEVPNIAVRLYTLDLANRKEYTFG